MTNRRVSEEIMEWDIEDMCKAPIIECMHCLQWTSKTPQCFKPFAPATDLNHTGMALKKLTDAQRKQLLINEAVKHGLGDYKNANYTHWYAAMGGLADLFSDPAKLCEAMLSAKETT